jgi:hypothetical protein
VLGEPAAQMVLAAVQVAEHDLKVAGAEPGAVCAWTLYKNASAIKEV